MHRSITVFGCRASLGFHKLPWPIRLFHARSTTYSLAFAGGVDGLVIQWDEGEISSVGDAMDGTREVVGKGVEAGADAVEKGFGKIEGWMKADDLLA